MQNLAEIETLNEYLTTYGKELVDTIFSDAEPLFHPGNPWDRQMDNLMRKPFQAQGDVIMAASRVLNRENSACVAADCGVGKTLISMSIPYIHSQNKKYRTLVICPGHITRKWRREVESTIPDSRGIILRKLKDISSLDISKKPTCNEYYILSKDKGKLSYSWRPAVIQNRHKEGYLCPQCCQTVYNDDNIALEWDDFKRKKLKCQSCNSPLWSADRNGIRRFALGEYIKKYLKGFFDYLIADEVHQYKGGNTAQGNMFGSLVSACSKTISLTGTLSGGYADELHFIIGRTGPAKLIADDLKISESIEFTKKYGVLERVTKIYHDEDNSCSKGKKGKTILKRLPGISPYVYSKFLMKNTVFLHLDDLAIDLPTYNEEIVSVKMGSGLEKAYQKLESDIREEVRKAISRGSTRLLGIMVTNLLSYPDRPFNNSIIVDSGDDKKIISIPGNLPENVIYPKEVELVRRIKDAKEKKRKVWVFCEYTEKRDVTKRLQNILTKEDIYTAILRSSVKPELREEWIENKVREGIDVIISNPKIVETGIDLLDFPELIFFENPLSCYTLRQASRRSLRLNQTEDVNVTFMYYRNTMQDRMISLIGSKLSSCLALEGKLTDDGLASVSSDSMIVELAKSLINNSQADNGADAIWKKINLANKKYSTGRPVKKEDKKEEKPCNKINTPAADNVIWVDFNAYSSKRKKKNKIISGTHSEIDRLLKEKKQTAVQLSLF